MTREIILDTETTGLDPYNGHRIVEIGCIELVSGSRTGKFFHRYLNPERDIPEESYRVHGLSIDFLIDKPIFSQVVDEFLEFIADAPLIIHNAGFDIRFLNVELERLGFKIFPMHRAVDTVAIAKKKFPGSPASLDALCKRFEIDLSARSKHGALLDAELLSEVYIELTGGRQVTLGFEQDHITNIEITAAATPKTFYEPRPFIIAETEALAHHAMLAQLKNPLWLA